MNGNSRGHILLVAIALTAVLSLAMALAIRPIRTAHQRMTERDLIYQGEHLAEGIKRFYFKYRRFPFDLDELVELEPRMVRRVYPDPTSDSGEWQLIYLDRADQSRLQNLNIPESLREVVTEQLEGGQAETTAEPKPKPFDSVFQIKTRQITGIRPSSKETGLMVYQDSQIYSDWTFSALPRPSQSLGDLTQSQAP